jgi:hypothetical protein
MRLKVAAELVDDVLVGGAFYFGDSVDYEEPQKLQNIILSDLKAISLVDRVVHFEDVGSDTFEF